MDSEQLRYRHIRDLREDADMTQQKMANILGCTQVAYSNYELGKRDIPTQTLIRLADHFNCSIDYLLGRTDNPEIMR
ncbi:MAG: helix-turn-helix transcriptional regulator [Lachnospiraceae bacterium]|nr:helix-turn-helix transcriptional regulator [Lachnospiraceae bacterium]